MDRIDAAVTPSVTTPTDLAPTAAPVTGLGQTFRALAQGTVAERRRRSLRGTARDGRVVAPAADAGTDSGTWRLAL